MIATAISIIETVGPLVAVGVLATATATHDIVLEERLHGLISSLLVLLVVFVSISLGFLLGISDSSGPLGGLPI